MRFPSPSYDLPPVAGVASSSSSSAAAFDFAALAQTLVEIGGGGRRGGDADDPHAAGGSLTRASSTQSQNGYRIRTQRQSFTSPAAEQEAAPLPLGMQLLCSLAAGSLHPSQQQSHQQMQQQQQHANGAQARLGRPQSRHGATLSVPGQEEKQQQQQASTPLSSSSAASPALSPQASPQRRRGPTPLAPSPLRSSASRLPSSSMPRRKYSDDDDAEDGLEEGESAEDLAALSGAPRKTSSRRSDASDDGSRTEAGEYDDVLNEVPERMAYSRSPDRLMYSRSPGGALMQLSRAGQQLTSPARVARSTAPFHRTQDFSTLSQRTPFKQPRRMRAFQLTSPGDAAQEEEEDDEEDQQPQTAIVPAQATASATAAPWTQHAVVPVGRGSQQLQVHQQSQSHTQQQAVHDLQLHYEHLQQALHAKELAHAAALASDVQRRGMELDAALGLSVGVEPSADVLARLAQPQQMRDEDMPDGSTSGAEQETTPSGGDAGGISRLLAQARSYAEAHSVRSLGAAITSAQQARRSDLTAALEQMQTKQSQVLGELRNSLSDIEARRRKVFKDNLAILTRMRDDAVKAALERKRLAELAAEAERKRKEEERIAAEKRAQEAKELAAKKAQEEAARKQAAAAAQAQAVSAQQAEAMNKAMAGGQFLPPSAHAVNEYEERKKQLVSVRGSGQAWASNPANRARKMQIFMQINKATGQISGTQQQISQKTRELDMLLRQCASQEELCYSLDVLCGKFVGIAKQKVRLQPAAAFPLALVASMLAQSFKPFSDMFIASLAEVCPYIVPYYPERKNFPTARAYMIAVGYEEQPLEDAPPAAEGQPRPEAPLDTEEQFFERMVGYVCLYAAYMQCDGQLAGQQQPHPHGIDRAWVWLARLVNQAPRTATASVLYAMLSIAGHTLFQRYPNQTNKLLALINSTFLLKLDPKTPPRKASQAVLALWLQTTMHTIHTQGAFPVPEGKNIPVGQESDASEQVIHREDM